MVGYAVMALPQGAVPSGKSTIAVMPANSCTLLHASHQAIPYVYCRPGGIAFLQIVA